MVSGYHAFVKRDNVKLGLAIDCGLAVAVLVMAIWYVSVPTFWEFAASGKEVAESLWLSWYPLVLAGVGLVIGGTCGHYLHGVFTGWFSPMARVVFFLGLSFIAVLMVYRIQTIQRLRENQVGYLNHCVGYMQQVRQQQQGLLSSLSASERTLSAILEKPEIGPGIESAVGALHSQVEAELESVNNLRLGGREQAAEIESARAHDLRAQGTSPEAYIESLARQKPGPELIGSQNGLDPLLHAEATELAAGIVETGMRGCWPSVEAWGPSHQ
jgi:hypothetical protein